MGRFTPLRSRRISLGINPISAFSKQNFGEEAKKIAQKMRSSMRGLVAPNGKPGKLWVATRLELLAKLGLHDTADLFGELIPNAAFQAFVDKYAKEKLKDLNARSTFLNATTRKKSDIYAKEYETTINNPTLLKAEKAKNAELRTKWQNPYLHPELRQELQDAYKKADLAGWAAAEQRAKQNTPDTPAESNLPLFTDTNYSIIGPHAQTWENTAEIHQQNILNTLSKEPALEPFRAAIDKVQNSKNRDFKQDDIVFGQLTEQDLSRLSSQNPDWPSNYNLHNAPHIIREADIWHMYRGHCLDYFLKDNGLNLTYDDIRMIPDILKNYDSITPDYKDGRRGIVYVKNYGGVEYRYAAYISKAHRRSKEPQGVHLITGWITKKAVNRDALTHKQPQATSASRFHRTAIITPLQEHIKQNYGEEAKKIVKYAKDHDITLHAPNGKISNLTPVQWLATRLQSFKNWFGDWESSPDTASKVVDENGEPMVVYHGARHAGFREFDNEVGVRQSAAPDGTSFFSSSRAVAYSYAGSYEEPDLHDEEMQEEIEEYGIEQMDSGIYEVFLNIRDPHTIDFKGRNWQPDEAFYSLVDENGDYIYPLNGEEYYNTEDEATERAEALGLKDYEVYSEYKDTNSVAQEGMDMGADGVIIENVIDEGSYGYGDVATDYIVFSANQVKSATQNRGTFDGGNADITFSVIGPKAKTWDKYKERAFTGRDDGMQRAEIDASGAVVDGDFTASAVNEEEIAAIKAAAEKNGTIDFNRQTVKKQV